MLFFIISECNKIMYSANIKYIYHKVLDMFYYLYINV